MRLIASPHLSQADGDAIAQGLKQREDVITAVLLHELEQLDKLAHDQLGYLAWLLRKGRLEIKLAVGSNTFLPHLTEITGAQGCQNDDD